MLLMIDIKNNFNIFLFCIHINKIQIFNKTKSIIRFKNITIEFKNILKTRNQQNYTINTTIFFIQTNNNKNF